MVFEQWRCERGLGKHPFVRAHGIVRSTLCANRLLRIVAVMLTPSDGTELSHETFS